ncbi:MAG: hypothetical protein GY743_20690 [Planctomycetaceae bacterium]|nr:hypothetical protein [Planctomycetaceae bacterium]
MSFLTKVIIAVFFVIFILPLAGIAVLQGASTYTMALIFNELEEKIENTSGLKAFPNVTNVTNAKGKRDLRAMAEISQFSDYRQAKIIYSINVRDLRDSNGKKITGARVKSLSGIIASVYANKECKLLTHNLASSCDVLQTKGKILTHYANKQEFLRIKMSLRFVQKDDFGTFDTDADLQFEKLNSAKFGGKSVKIQLRNQKKLSAWRLKIYEMIADNCKEVKKVYGNCAINGLSVASSIQNLRNKAFYFGIVGHAQFGVLKDEA